MLRTSQSLTVFCVCFFLLPVLAQQTKLAEPDVMDVVYLRDASDQALKPLPKQPAKVVTHRGFASAKGAIQIPGPASSFRIKAGTELEFVVKSASPDSYQLFAFTKKGDNREAIVANAKASLFGSVSTQQVGVLTLEVAKYGEQSYRFVVRSADPGEYGFAVGWSVFDFAVEPK